MLKYPRTSFDAEGMEALKNCLDSIPFIETVCSEKDNSPDSGVDYTVQIRSSQCNQRLAVAIRANGQPRYARAAANAFLRYQADNPGVYGVFIAQYISPQSARICTEAGIGYLDLSGNCFLSFQQVHIVIKNRPNKFRKRRDLVSLYFPKTERVLRVLLTYPYRLWRTTGLAETASVSPGMVSHIKKRLAEREWVQSSRRGFTLSEPKALLEEWEANYSFRRNAISDFYTLKSLAEIESALAEVCQRESLSYALTAFSASNRLAPSIRNQRAMAYVRGDIPAVAAELGLKPVASGANVSLLQPYDEGIFWNANEVDGLSAATPIQVYLDLKQFRGRGEEAAQFLFDEVIEKQWSTQQTTVQTL